MLVSVLLKWCLFHNLFLVTKEKVLRCDLQGLACVPFWYYLYLRQIFKTYSHQPLTLHIDIKKYKLKNKPAAQAVGADPPLLKLHQ